MSENCDKNNKNYSENCMADCDELYCDTCHAQTQSQEDSQEDNNVEIKKVVALMKFFQNFNLSKEAYEVLGDALQEQQRMLNELNCFTLKKEGK